MKYFFIGIAGAGMSAIAQYLVGKGHKISGSDRQFLCRDNNDTRQKLENLGIECFAQGETTPALDTDFVVVSTAIEESVNEYKFSKDHNLKIIHRSDLLAEICDNCKTIAVAGTSGKSTTTAMIYHILQRCGKEPSLITGAGLKELQDSGLIGNAFVDKGDFLVIEVDESDGTIVKYHPEIGLILNIDKDHKEISELTVLFKTFAQNTRKKLIVNADNIYSAQLSTGNTFSASEGKDFVQTLQGIKFNYNNVGFSLSIIGRYNMENAISAIKVCEFLGLSTTEIAVALRSYQGIFRRATIVDTINDITIIDDFAHNPAKIAAMLSSCQSLTSRIIAWFQPHGFAPSRLMKDELIEKLTSLLRCCDIIIFSKIYYAGGTANQTISAQEFADALTANGKNALYIEDRQNLIPYLKQTAQSGDIILLMGARDPSLSNFATTVKEGLIN